jgi:hypothetical protein
MTHRKPIQYEFAENRMRSNLIILTVCRYQYWLPEDIHSQPERKTNTQVTLILFIMQINKDNKKSILRSRLKHTNHYLSDVIVIIVNTN